MKKFDALVTAAWKGRPEGMELTSLEGCTFRVYSTVAAAINAGNTIIEVKKGEYDAEA